MDKHSHIIQLRERKVTYFPADSQQPVLQHQAEEEPWADRAWRILIRPFARHFFWMGFWFAVGFFVIRAGIYLVQIGGVK